MPFQAAAFCDFSSSSFQISSIMDANLKHFSAALVVHTS